MNKHLKPDYTGLDYIKQLFDLSKGRVISPLPAENVDTKYFNNDGYLFNPPDFRTYKLLTIHKDIKGELQAYANFHGCYARLTKFTNPQLAKDIIHNLYHDPYYHSSSYYVDKLKALYESYDPTRYNTLEEAREEAHKLYEQASVLHTIIKSGANTYGCAHRFKMIEHCAYPVMNLYLANFEDKYWVHIGQTPLVYDGITTGDFKQNYVIKDIDKSTLEFINYPGLGLRLNMLEGGDDFIEGMLLEKLGCPDSDPVPDNLYAIIRVINQMAIQRGMFESDEHKNSYASSLNITLTEHELRKVFLERYIGLLKKVGYKVS